MDKTILTILISISIALLIITNINLISTSNSFDATVQTAKSQLDQSDKGLVNIPHPDYRIAVILSLTSLIIGIGMGWILFKD